MYLYLKKKNKLLINLSYEKFVTQHATCCLESLGELRPNSHKTDVWRGRGLIVHTEWRGSGAKQHFFLLFLERQSPIVTQVSIFSSHTFSNY